ncbi:MAG: hypothetical protein HY820_35395, partial [Acidobacteria bacterium]|nr:hypothetical protein [Acidobacteriota bacterium]
NAPLEAAQHQLEQRWFAYIPGFMITIALLVMGLVGLLAWRSEPSRYELFWFGMIGVQAFAAYTYIMVHLRGNFPPPRV